MKIQRLSDGKLIEGEITKVEPTYMMTLAHEAVFIKAKMSMMRFQMALSQNKDLKIINRCSRRVKVYTWKLHLMNQAIRSGKAA